MTTPLIVGTAGHIDHGKTALVRALTGVDADRLPEEKRRGMTIDLGFAALELDGYRLGIVDVPGHERFIRNMLAGAMAIDVAMLIVAASESIKPQTREHLQILEHAGIEQGVVALTKSDLVDSEWAEMVEQEVRELLDHSPLHGATIIHVSAVTGDGVAELRQALAAASARAAADPFRAATINAPFRMTVDRAFSLAGYGTVVTGSVASGSLGVGDEVAIEPAGTVARVRGLQSHGEWVESVERGQRAAVNLAGVPLQHLRRGDVLAEPGSVPASRCLCAHVRLSPSSRARPLQKLPVRVHLGTGETQGVLRCLEPASDNDAFIAELRLNEPVACVPAQPLVLRSPCATRTLGGGRVLDPLAAPRSRRSTLELQMLNQLACEEPGKRVAAAIYFHGTSGVTERSVSQRAGWTPPPSQVIGGLERQHQIVRLSTSAGRQLVVHREVLAALISRIVQMLERRHHREPLRAAFPRSVLHKILPPETEPGLLEAILEQMVKDRQLKSVPAGVALPGHSPQLSKGQRQEYTRIIESHRAAAFSPPTAAQLVESAASHRASVPKLLELAVAEGHLVPIGADWCLHWQVEQQMLEMLRGKFGGSAFAVSDLSDLLHTTRKYSVPLCEYLDRIGFTEREGDLRTIRHVTRPREECCR